MSILLVPTLRQLNLNHILKLNLFNIHFNISSHTCLFCIIPTDLIILVTVKLQYKINKHLCHFEIWTETWKWSKKIITNYKQQRLSINSTVTGCLWPTCWDGRNIRGHHYRAKALCTHILATNTQTRNMPNTVSQSAMVGATRRQKKNDDAGVGGRKGICSYVL